jgi:uncharacterized protein with FMN-binding domain
MLVGVMLLFRPDTGVVAIAEQALPSTAPSTTATIVTTTAAPPDPVGTTTDPSTSTTAPETTTTTTEAPPRAITVTGDAANSPFGPFQVEIVVADGTITDITTLTYPQDRHSQRINAVAIPYYTDQALAAQSTDFSAISGATVTWQSWRASLASAIGQAGI